VIAPTTIKGVGEMLLDVWSTTKLLVDEVHALHAKINEINEYGCRRHRIVTGPVLPVGHGGNGAEP